ncbi:hypothetical protein [Caulobacter mirabilis]|uniref:YbjN domain-containing protein n=1 Tax=Caulobacter mirabilis TaxID=69666 RepID=A0A2D2AU38_9CAUL|nr:hypothetical protein [Caulobacter mirabilis]ATQ41493.1 hypothetical protein CSW64_03225 [Caulobacter mirabilis]
MIVTAIAAAALLAAEPAVVRGAPAEPPPVVWRSLRRADAEALLREEGAKVVEIGTTDEGGWWIDAEAPDNLPFTWKGMQCEGDGENRACTEHMLITYIPTSSSKVARAIVAERNVMYPADAADKADYSVWRMDFTYGGVTREHVRHTLSVTIDLFWKALDVVREQDEGGPSKSGAAKGKGKGERG